MATGESSSEGQFKIYNYFETHDDTTSHPDFESWAEEIKKLTKDKMIVSWHHYTSPLKFLKVFGNAARRMTKRLSRNHGLFHKFLTFELRDMNGDKEAVSFEKVRSGLLFQIAKENKTVKENTEGTNRKDVKVHESSKKLGFEGQLINNLTTIEKILESEAKFDAFYHVLFNNCQQTVSECQEALIERSLSLKLRVPGSGECLVLNDPQMVGVIEEMFPKWKEDKVQQFPELPNPFAFDVTVPVANATDDYGFLLYKQRVSRAIIGLLEKDDAISVGRKAVMSNLDKCRYEKALALTGDVPSRIADQISELWSAAFEIVVIVEAVGVLIFSFQAGNVKTDRLIDLDEMMSLASKIEKVPKKAGKCIHLINVKLNAASTSRSPMKERSEGYLLNVSFSEATLKDEEALQRELLSSIRDIREKTLRQQSMDRINYLRSFATRLFILQNLGNEEGLIHERVERQEWGSKGCCIWTTKQRQILDEAREAFLEKKEIHWEISGCYGSGKTMVMVQMARDYQMLRGGNRSLSCA